MDLTEEDVVIDPQTGQAIMAALGDGPMPASFEELLGMVKNNDTLRAEMVKLMVAQTGVPPSVAELVFRNADKLNALTPDQFAEQLLATAPRSCRMSLEFRAF